MNKHESAQLAIINAAKAMGVASGKTATAIKSGIGKMRKAQADDFKTETYDLFLAGRKVKELDADDRRTYDAMRTAFSRVFKEKYGKKEQQRGSNKNTDKTVSGAILHWCDETLDNLSKAEKSDVEIAAVMKLTKDYRAAVNALRPAK